jgi:hypothetical protein
VPDGLTGVPLAAEEEGVGTGRLAEGKLVEGEALSAGLFDAGARGAGEAERGDRELGEGLEASVVGDGADGDDGVLVGVGLVRLADLAGDARDRQGRAVDARLVQATEDDLVEARVGAAGEEPVQLDEQEQVRVLRLGGGALALLDVVALNVDSLRARGPKNTVLVRSLSSQGVPCCESCSLKG